MAHFLNQITADQFAIWGLNVLLQVTVITVVTLAFGGLLRRNPAARNGMLCLSLALLLFTPVIALLAQASGHTLLALSLSDNRIFDRSVARPAAEPLETESPDQASGHRNPDTPIATTATSGVPSSQPAVNAHNAQDESNEKALGLDALTLPIGADAQTIPRMTPRFRTTTLLLRRVMPPILGIWLCGSLLLFCRIAAGCLRLNALLRNARPIPAVEKYRMSLARALRSSGIQGASPLIVTSPQVTSPLAAGVWRSHIVLPENMQDRVTSEQLEQILIHEAAHVVRRDPLCALLQNIVAAMFWLHPLVHVLNRQLARTREEVCDNYVLGTTDAPAYSRTLLSLAELASRTRQLPCSVALFTSRWRLENRIAGILDERRKRTTRLPARAKACIVAIAMLAAIGAVGGTLSLVSAPAALANAENLAAKRGPLTPPSAGVDLVSEVVKQLESDAQADAANGAQPDKALADELEAKIALLDKVAAGAKANYERIRTWKGSGKYRVVQTWDYGPLPFKQQLRREADIRFQLDLKANALSFDWEETQPIRLFGEEPSAATLLTTDLLRFRSIVTDKEWLDFRTARRFATPEQPLFGFDSSDDPRLLIIRSPSAEKNLKSEAEGYIDPRDWTGLSGRHVQNDRQYFWDEHKWLKEVDAKYQRENKGQSVFNYCDVIEQPGEAGMVVVVRRYWALAGKPDRNDPNTARRDVTFEERYGYAMTGHEYWSPGAMHEKAVIAYEKRGDTAVPVRFTRTVNDGQFQQQRDQVVEVRLTESEINVPIEPSQFTVETLHLKDGDHVLRDAQKAYSVIEQGKPVPIATEKNSSIATMQQPSTSLWHHSIFTREWNDLIHANVELNNSWMRAEPEQLPAADRKQAYAQNRQAWEQLAHRYLALHPYHDERPETLNSLHCLGEVVRMEYAGPVADEAAAILLKDGSLKNAEPTTAVVLAFSMPTSLAAEAVLRGIIEQSGSRATQAQARMSLAHVLLAQSEKARMIKNLPGRAERVAEQYGDWYLDRLRQVDPDRAVREAEDHCKYVADNYADVANFRDNEKMTDAAKQELKWQQHAIGRKAPEIVGKDFDDKPLKLSDSDGKVRVLMFWGHWCGPCHRNYPHLRALMAKHANAPFAVLGVCSDKEKKAIRAAVEDGTINWQFWWSGNDRWKIHEEWGLMGSPWIYVLDGKGIVRFAGIEGQELDDAVDLLLQETAGNAK